MDLTNLTIVLVVLTAILVFLTTVLLVASILSYISSVRLKGATDKLATIQLCQASASLSRTLYIPNEWLTENIKALEDTLNEAYPQKQILNALKKGLSPKELIKLEQTTLPIKWSLYEDKLIITFPINFASRILELLLIDAKEPDKIKESFFKSPLVILAMKEEVV